MKLQKVKRVVSASMGELPLKAKGGTFRPSSYTRETQNAETHENIGFTETPEPAELKVNLQATMDAESFAGITNDTLTVFIDNGKTHVMPNSWTTDPVPLGDGEIQVTYHCGKSQQLN